MKKRIIRRGQIYDIGKIDTVGSEQHGERPIVIVQNDDLNINEGCPTVSYLFITSKTEKVGGRKTHVLLPDVEGLPKQSMVLVEQPNTADIQRLLDYRGMLDEQTMNNIGRKLKYALGLSHKSDEIHEAQKKRLKIELGLEEDRSKKRFKVEWRTKEGSRQALLDNAQPVDSRGDDHE